PARKPEAPAPTRHRSHKSIIDQPPSPRLNLPGGAPPLSARRRKGPLPSPVGQPLLETDSRFEPSPETTGELHEPEGFHGLGIPCDPRRDHHRLRDRAHFLDARS